MVSFCGLVMDADGDILSPHYHSMDFFSQQENSKKHFLLSEEEEEEILLQRLSENYLLDNNSHCQDHHLPIISSTPRDLGQASTVSEYDLGGEGDLFKAPKPIIEEPAPSALDPVTSVISMISEPSDVETMETIKSELLSEVFYECKKDLILLEKPAIEEPPSDLSDIRIQPLPATGNEDIQQNNMVADEGPANKTAGTTSFDGKDRRTAIPFDQKTDCPSRPNFLDFQEMDFGAAFKMRRAYSEGDIKILGNHNTSMMGANTSGSFPTVQRVLSMGKYKSEERLEKLSRYRKKKKTRNFGRKIKYACRKTLAECQPRIRGRFARTEEMELPKLSM